MKFRKQTGPGATVTFAVSVIDREDDALDGDVQITADGEPVSSFNAEFAVVGDDR